MAGAEDPLVEEGLEGPAGDLADGGEEVPRARGGVGMFLEQAGDGFAEWLVAHDPAEHVEHGRAFLVGVAVEVLIRGFPALPDDGAAVLRTGFLEIDVALVHQIECAFVFAERVFRVKIFAVGGEAFVDPGFAPVAHGYQVAPPLVRGFVGDQPVGGEVLVGLFVVDLPVADDGGGGAFGAAAEAGDGDLVVLVPREGDAVFVFEETQDFAGAAEDAGGIGLVPRVDPEVDGESSGGVGYPDVRAGDEDEQIGGMRLVLDPVEAGAGGGWGDGGEAAVGDRLVALRDGDDDLGGGLVGGMVIGGEPVAGAFGEREGVDEPGVIGRLRFEAEAEVVAGGHAEFHGIDVDLSGLIGDGEGCLFAAAVGTPQVDGQLAGGLGEAEAAPGVGDGGDAEGFGVEFAGGEAVAEGQEGDGGEAVEGAGGFVEAEFDAIALDVVAAGEAGRRGRGGEGGGGRGEEGQVGHLRCSRMNFSISSGEAGMKLVKFSTPVGVTATTSSMRM